MKRALFLLALVLLFATLAAPAFAAKAPPKWKIEPALPQSVYALGAAATPDGSIYAIGGATDAGDVGRRLRFAAACEDLARGSLVAGTPFMDWRRRLVLTVGSTRLVE